MEARHNGAMRRIGIAALVVLIGGLAASLVLPMAANGGGGGCRWRHFFYDGNPTVHELTMLAEHTVPDERTWKVTNVSLLVEKHHGGTADAGEFTAVIDGFDGDQRLIVGQSTTPADDGIGLQAQGATNIGLETGSEMRFMVWLRPNDTTDGSALDPANYYYTLGATVRDCHT